MESMATVFFYFATTVRPLNKKNSEIFGHEFMKRKVQKLVSY